MTLLSAELHSKLTPEQLKLTCNPDEFKFDSTTSLDPIHGIVGQEHAVKALKVGVDIKGPGYNIFITGLSGTGKLSSVRKILTEFLKTKKKLYDYAYVYNFRDEDHPTLLVFPTGQGKKFKFDLESTIKFLQENIPQILDTEPFLTKRKNLVKKFGENQKKLMEDFQKKLEKDHLTLGEIKVGDVARPELLAVVDDQVYYIQQLDELVEQKKITKRRANTLVKKYSEHQDELQTVFKKSLKLAQNFNGLLAKLEAKAVTDLVNVTFEQLKNKYKQKKVKKYLERAADSIFKNLEIFKRNPAVQAAQPDGRALEILKNYQVNLILDNSRTKKTPVVIETSPTYTKG